MSAPLILCIEDEAPLRDDIAFELRDAGFRVIAAADAAEALRRLEGWKPDLILCDIVMPGMDGKALLAHLRRTRPDLNAVPIVFLTALSSRAQMIEGRSLGADDYLTKPIDYDLLRVTIESRLAQVRRMEPRRDTSGLAALDRLALGVILLAADGKVVHANPAARALAKGSELELSERVMARGELGRSLAALIDRLIRDEAKCSPEGVSLASDGQIMVMGLPLGAGQPSGRAAAMLILSDPRARHMLHAATLAQMFGLTPTEARIAGLLSDGLRRDEIAEQMAISPTTVAFHLRNLFSKTGVHREAALVALILSLPALRSGPELGPVQSDGDAPLSGA
ncbi:MAG: response regulator [Paracoccaceae bacterium]